jgi:hypothetical protein
MGRHKSNAYLTEDYRKVPKSVSLPAYLVRDLEAQGKLSMVLTEILETHKQAIGDGVHMDVMKRRKDIIAYEVDAILRERLPLLIEEAIAKAMQKVLK